MNKFNKKLTISVPEDPVDTLENESPSVPDSIQQDKYDKEGLLQFREFRDGGDSEYGDPKNEPKLNFVEF